MIIISESNSKENKILSGFNKARKNKDKKMNEDDSPQDRYQTKKSGSHEVETKLLNKFNENRRKKSKSTRSARVLNENKESNPEVTDIIEQVEDMYAGYLTEGASKGETQIIREVLRLLMKLE